MKYYPACKEFTVKDGIEKRIMDLQVKTSELNGNKIESEVVKSIMEDCLAIAIDEW